MTPAPSTPATDLAMLARQSGWWAYAMDEARRAAVLAHVAPPATPDR